MVVVVLQFAACGLIWFCDCLGLTYSPAGTRMDANLTQLFDSNMSRIRSDMLAIDSTMWESDEAHNYQPRFPLRKRSKCRFSPDYILKQANTQSNVSLHHMRLSNKTTASFIRI